MKLNPIGSNCNEIEVGGLLILMSYQTPVACYSDDGGYKRTSKKWSKTTSKHINNWMKGWKGTEESQEFFDSLLDEVK